VSKVVAKWLIYRFTKIWKQFKYKEFSFKDALRITGDRPENLRVVIQRLENAGWVEKKLNLREPRKKIYKIKNLELIFSTMDF